MSKTYLYILVFPQRSVIKIGKADDIHSRLDSLRRWWGDVDYAESYLLPIAPDSVFKLEKSLHFLLSSYAMEAEAGDGRTELFSMSALEQAKKYIDLYLASNSDEGPLQKGISIPVKIIASPYRPTKADKIEKKSRKLVESLTNCNVKFNKLNRLIALLIRRQAWIQFQHDRRGDNIYFRVRHSRSTNAAIAHSVMSLFSFSIEDFNGWYGVNCCSAIGVDNIVQYEIRAIKSTDDGLGHAYLSYLWEQLERALSQLPSKSLAAIEDIPIIDVT